MKIPKYCIFFYFIVPFASTKTEDPGTTTGSPEEPLQPDLTTSIWIILGFLSIILLLFAIGFGCSYLCYKRSANKIKNNLQLQRNQIINHQTTTPNVVRHAHKRGVPNWYAPTPKDDIEANDDNNMTTHLINTITVPTQIQNYYGS